MNKTRNNNEQIINIFKKIDFFSDEFDGCKGVNIDSGIYLYDKENDKINKIDENSFKNREKIKGDFFIVPNGTFENSQIVKLNNVLLSKKNKNIDEENFFEFDLKNNSIKNNSKIYVKNPLNNLVIYGYIDNKPIFQIWHNASFFYLKNCKKQIIGSFSKGNVNIINNQKDKRGFCADLFIKNLDNKYNDKKYDVAKDAIKKYINTGITNNFFDKDENINNLNYFVEIFKEYNKKSDNLFYLQYTDKNSIIITKNIILNSLGEREYEENNNFDPNEDYYIVKEKRVKISNKLPDLPKFLVDKRKLENAKREKKNYEDQKKYLQIFDNFLENNLEIKQIINKHFSLEETEPYENNYEKWKNYENYNDKNTIISVFLNSVSSVNEIFSYFFGALTDNIDDNDFEKIKNKFSNRLEEMIKLNNNIIITENENELKKLKTLIENSKTRENFIKEYTSFIKIDEEKNKLEKKTKELLKENEIICNAVKNFDKTNEEHCIIFSNLYKYFSENCEKLKKNEEKMKKIEELEEITKNKEKENKNEYDISNNRNSYNTKNFTLYNKDVVKRLLEKNKKIKNSNIIPPKISNKVIQKKNKKPFLLSKESKKPTNLPNILK